MANTIDELKNKIYGALGDPEAPWYGSDVVSWVGDYINEAEKRIKELEEQIGNLNESHRKDEYRWQKALKEQGFDVGPFVEGPDIRD